MCRICETLAAAGVHEEVIHLDEVHAEESHIAKGELLRGEEHGTEGHEEGGGPSELGGAEGEPADLEERQPESNASAPQALSIDRLSAVAK